MIKKAIYFISGIMITAVLIWVTPSCGNTDRGNKEQQPQVGQARLFAVVIDTSGKKIPTIVLRVISEAIKLDSATKKKVIAYDTIFGVERTFQLKDSLNKPLKDSLGNFKYGTGYFPIGKDSVNTGVCGQPIDSLIKK